MGELPPLAKSNTTTQRPHYKRNIKLHLPQNHCWSSEAAAGPLGCLRAACSGGGPGAGARHEGSVHLRLQPPLVTAHSEQIHGAARDWPALGARAAMRPTVLPWCFCSRRSCEAVAVPPDEARLARARALRRFECQAGESRAVATTLGVQGPAGPPSPDASEGA